MIKKSPLLILSFLLIVTLSNCLGRRTATQEDNQDSCVESELYLFFKKVADRFPHITDMDMQPVDTCFYYAYFFQENDGDYVTLWRHTTEVFLDILIEKNPDKTFQHSWFKVSPYYFILIKEQSSEFEELISPCEECLRDMVDLPEHYHITDDGPLYARTYKISENNGQYDFERQDNYIIDFLGEEWVKWEEMKMNGMIEDYPHAVWY